MSMHFGDIAARAAADGAIGADEILTLRQAGWADGKMDPEEAESLFQANEALRTGSPEWSQFFVEALSQFIVNTVEPKGYVDDAMGEELVARIDRDGKVDSLAELELLVKVLEIALHAPSALKTYTLKQVEAAVLHGEGPTRQGALDPKGINEVECNLLRRLIFSAGGDRPASVSQAEAEMLFRIKDATLYETNADGWEKLFVQGVANYLLGFGGHEPLSRERALELENFMNAPGLGLGSFLRRMLGSDVDTEVEKGFGSLLSIAPHTVGIEEEAEEAAHMDPAEELWLRDKIDADEELDPLEKALLAFIAEETGEELTATI